MKKNKLILSLLLAFIMLFTSPSFFYNDLEVKAATSASMQLESQTKNLVMVKGQKTSLKPPVKMTYQSSNPKIASVSSEGIIIAKARGSVIVTCKYKDVTWTFRIKIEHPKLNSTSLTLKSGQTSQLKLLRTTRKIRWYSGNKSIATVNRNGKISAKKAGNTYIAAKVNGISYKCKVTITANTPSDVWLSATGSKYHKIPNCGKMNPARARKVSLSFAQSHHYKPCSKCF